MGKRITKVLSLFLCFVIFANFSFNSVFANNQTLKEGKFYVVQNDQNLYSLKSIENGVVIVGTLNKISNEISIQTTEKSNAKIFGVSVGKDKQNDYLVKSHVMTDGEISAVIQDKLSKKETKIYKKRSAKRVYAQIPIVIGGGIAIGALIEALLVTAAITVTVVAAHEVSKTLSERFREKTPQVIYRLGSGTATNLTPRVQDSTLSYTIRKPISGPYTATTLKAVNATGKLVAFIDNQATGHVSVVSIPATRMKSWQDSRPNAEKNPHELTKLLQKISIKVK
jgi:hypothetical protein